MQHKNYMYIADKSCNVFDMTMPDIIEDLLPIGRRNICSAAFSERTLLFRSSTVCCRPVCFRPVCFRPVCCRLDCFRPVCFRPVCCRPVFCRMSSRVSVVQLQRFLFATCRRYFPVPTTCVLGPLHELSSR